ncbi:MAG: hypothetical protein HZB15_07935 [Actinobacteria bacterium]|nr:hypothetical protein [Actinomycetota bacterium]
MTSNTTPSRHHARLRFAAVTFSLMAVGGAALVACGGDDDENNLPVPEQTESSFGIPAQVDNSGVNQGPANTAEQGPGASVVANTGVAP